MQNAMWLASIFGPFLTIMGLWMLLYSENMTKVWNALKNAPASFYFGAVANLLIGLTILSQYDLWTSDVYVLVTLLGWVFLIRGIMGLFVPQMLVELTMGHKGFFKGMGIIPLVWGLALCWVAFFM
ncbi:MAG: hypothetical protein JSR58_01320 [Verrucomicrobia bacterium]|nr:hypothetical protein [Verrucomicrobiota bacterium]